MQVSRNFAYIRIIGPVKLLMKTIVVYDSVSGFTKRYAEWIADDLSAECVALSSISSLSDYDCVVFGGHIWFGNVTGIKTFKKLCGDMGKVVVFAVGSAPAVNNPKIPEIYGNIDKCLPQFKSVPHFYFQGGVKLEALPWTDRATLKCMVLMLKLLNLFARKPALGKVIQMMSMSHDEASKDAISPLVEYMRKNIL